MNFRIPVLTLALGICWLFLSAFTFTLFNKPGSESLTEALTLRDQQEYEEAEKLLQTAWDNAVDSETKSRAIAELGKLALTGHSTRYSPEQGIELLKKSESMGNTSVLLDLGKAYHYGKGITAQPEVAMQYYEKASATAPEAWLQMALLRPDAPEARGFFDNFLAQTPDISLLSRGTMGKIAKMYRDGTVVEQNFSETERWYRLAIQHGSVSSLGQLAKMWTDQGHVPTSDIAGLWQQYADQNKPEGQLVMGMSLIDGRFGNTINLEEGIEYLDMAAKARPDYQYRIGRFFEQLNKVTQNPQFLDQQMRWYRLAAKGTAKNNYKAMMKIARAYRFGIGENQNWDEAKLWYQKAVESGHPKAHIELAKLEGNEQRKILQAQRKAAKKLYQQKQKKHKAGTMSYATALPLAKSGNATAMREVGMALIQGRDVSADTEKGIEWLNKAASAGDSLAMRNLAKNYAAGTTGEYNLSKAYDWYLKAAKAGDAEAQYQLGLGYARGIGVVKDLAEAQKWLESASKNGLKHAATMLQSLQSQK